VRRATASYTAQNGGELSFKAGDIIIQIAPASNGMIKGMSQDGKVGLVPESMVDAF
jgi:hypothetical protein